MGLLHHIGPVLSHKLAATAPLTMDLGISKEENIYSLKGQELKAGFPVANAKVQAV